MIERIARFDMHEVEDFLVTYDSVVETSEDPNPFYALNGRVLTFRNTERCFDKEQRRMVDIDYFKVDGMSYTVALLVLPRGLCMEWNPDAKGKVPPRYLELIGFKEWDDEDQFMWELAGKNAKLGGRI